MFNNTSDSVVLRARRVSTDLRAVARSRHSNPVQARHPRRESSQYSFSSSSKRMKPVNALPFPIQLDGDVNGPVVPFRKKKDNRKQDDADSSPSSSDSEPSSDDAVSSARSTASYAPSSGYSVECCRVGADDEQEGCHDIVT